MKNYSIYYDMDNTIALFSKKGQDKEALKNMMNEGYFKNLPVMDGAIETLQTLQQQGYQVFILSACVDSKYCESEKNLFLDKYFPFIDKEHRIFTKIGENKVSKIKTDICKSLLVDDYSKNLQDWANAGGIAIKKRSSNKRKYQYIVRNHQDIFNILQ